jgi:hypothetical protein
MPLDPDKLRELSERAQSLSRRMDDLERRRADNEDDDDDDDDDELLDPAEEARRLTPGSDLAGPDIEEPWYE